MVKTVYVVFNDSGKEYAYKANFPVEVEDFVVVAPRGDYTVVQVVRVSDKVNPKAAAWLVDKVHTENYEKLLKDEERKKEIREQLDEAKKKMDELLVYQMLADSNPAMKELLDELKNLG